jgi:pimeloyl-ACP methyl ester carboxylesterase
MKLQNKLLSALLLLAVNGAWAAPLEIRSQGVFAAGGSITAPVPGTYDPTKNWLDTTRAGNTAHIDHASVLFQIPAEVTGSPIVFLHGYGQSRLGWMSTPDGRPGWSSFFLRAGHSVFLVDQPRRGEAGATAKMTSDGFLDAWAADSKGYKPGDQAWYTHFRIGRVLPGRYEGSQFPEGEEALNQFLRQGTPNTGDYEEKLFGKTLGDVLADVRRRTGLKSVYVTHSQGGRVGWATPVENIAAIIAIEPGGTPEPGGEQFNALLAAKVPVLVYFGDYIDNGPQDIMSTGFWQTVLNQCRAFAEQYVKDGGVADVIHLPERNIHGNSHFMFQEMNNKDIADHIEGWLAEHGLT